MHKLAESNRWYGNLRTDYPPVVSSSRLTGSQAGFDLWIVPARRVPSTHDSLPGHFRCFPQSNPQSRTLSYRHLDFAADRTRYPMRRYRSLEHARFCSKPTVPRSRLSKRPSRFHSMRTSYSHLISIPPLAPEQSTMSHRYRRSKPGHQLFATNQGGWNSIDRGDPTPTLWPSLRRSEHFALAGKSGRCVSCKLQVVPT